MDKSLDHIEMARAAEEIQALRPRGCLYHEGDYFADIGYGGKWFVTLATTNGKGRNRSIYFRNKTSVWLPDQSQYQAILKCDWFDLIQDLHYFALEELPLDDGIAKAPPVAYCNSMHQVMLAMVMWHPYGKVWNGEKWIMTRRLVYER